MSKKIVAYSGNTEWLVAIGQAARNADLPSADFSGIKRTGARLTGAIWTNGKKCKEDSIGKCIV